MRLEKENEFRSVPVLILSYDRFHLSGSISTGYFWQLRTYFYPLALIGDYALENLVYS